MKDFEIGHADLKKLLRLADAAEARPSAIPLSLFLAGFQEYLTTYVDSDAAVSYEGNFVALADREGLSTVISMLYAECKAAFPDLEVQIAEEKEKSRAYFVMLGTTEEKNPESSVQGVARAAKRDYLSFHWARKIAEASGFSLGFEWRKNRVLVALVLPSVEAPAPLCSHGAPLFDEAAARFAAALLGRLPSDA